MEQNILNSNKIVVFLNKLMDLGFDANEAATIATRLELDITFRLNPDKNRDTSSLKYQICNDLVSEYEKKYGNTDDKMLELTVLSVINNTNFDNIQEFDSNYNMLSFYNNILNGEISIQSILAEVGYSFDDKYGVNDIQIDYFTNNIPYIYITIDYNHVVILGIEENKIKFINEEVQDTAFEEKLYNDYYEFAINTYCEGDERNDIEGYARFFAACYSNMHLSEKERIAVLNTFNEIEGDFASDDFKNLVVYGNYQKIKNALKKYYSKENIIKK